MCEQQFLTDKVTTLEISCRYGIHNLPEQMEVLLNNGALDVFYLPTSVKNSLGIGLRLFVICSQTKKDFFINFLKENFPEEQLTVTHQTRYKLHRQFIAVDLYGRKVKVKCGYFMEEGQKQFLQIVPEYDDCKILAKELKMPLKQIYDQTKAAAFVQLENL